jgi:hypothetical protein
MLALGLVGGPCVLIAQSNTTAALTGAVRDSAGRPLTGAVVRVSSPSLIGGERTTATVENGAYRMPGLPPGRYRIVVEAKGHTPLTGAETLELGRTSTVNWKFPANTSSAVVEVVATAAELDATPVGLTQNYDTTALATLPVDRSMEGIMNLTPGVNGKQAWGGGSKENAWLMDGMNIGDPSGNSQWLYANPDWFSEVQVGGIGAPAEYGNFNGGYTNALVKRGGNEFEGAFNIYYADSKWEAKTSNRYPGLVRDLGAAKNYDVALNVGGPIIKDKLWFFASAWKRQEESTPIGALATTKRNYSNFLAKFTWQATPSATLEALMEYDGLPVDHKGLDSTTMPEASAKQIAPDRLFSLNWTQTLSSNLVFTAKVSGYSGNYEQRPYNGDLQGLDTEDTLSTNGVEFFSNATWYQNDYRNRLEGVATLDYFKTDLIFPGDSHAFRFGIEQAQASDEETRRPTGGFILYGYEGDTPGTVVPDYFATGGGWMIKERTNRSALYLQDTWTINDRLSLRPGVRMERFQAAGYGKSTIWDRKVVAPRIGGSVALTSDLANVLKFHWGKYYAAFSTYFVDRAYSEWAPAEKDYVWNGPESFNPLDRSTWGAMPNPATAELIAEYPSISPLDPNAKQPYTEETTVAFEHKFSGPWSLTASWVFREQKDILVRKDISSVTSGPNATGTWEQGSFWDYRNDPEGNTSRPFTYWLSGVNPDTQKWLIATAPDAKRNYVAGSIVLERKWMEDWSLNASFTRARRYGNMSRSDGYDSWGPYENPNYLVNANGLLPGYNDYEAKIHSVIALPWTMKFAVSFTYLSGERYTPYVQSSKNDYGKRAYVFIETRGAEKYPSEHLLDTRISKDVKFSKKQNLELFAQVFNTLNSGTTLTFKSERANSSNYGVPGTVEQGRRLQLGVRYTF